MVCINGEGKSLDEILDPVSDEQKKKIRYLLDNVRVDDDQQRRILFFLSCPTGREADKLIRWLEDSQIDRIDSGHNYSQTDILIKLKKFI